MYVVLLLAVSVSGRHLLNTPGRYMEPPPFRPERFAEHGLPHDRISRQGHVLHMPFHRADHAHLYHGTCYHNRQNFHPRTEIGERHEQINADEERSRQFRDNEYQPGRVNRGMMFNGQNNGHGSNIGQNTKTGNDNTPINNSGNVANDNVMGLMDTVNSPTNIDNVRSHTRHNYNIQNAGNIANTTLKPRTTQGAVNVTRIRLNKSDSGSNLNSSEHHRQISNYNRTKPAVKSNEAPGITKTMTDNEVTVNPLQKFAVNDKIPNEEKWVWEIETTTVSNDNVTLDDRGAFTGDKCPSNMARVMGVCKETD